MEILKQLRQKSNKRQADVASDIGISFQALSHYENGHREPDFATLNRLAEYYNVSVDYLLGRPINNNEQPLPVLYDGKVVKIPCYEAIHAGTPTASITNFTEDSEWEEIPAHLLKSGEYFAIKVIGNSMAPHIQAKDILIVRQQSTVENGEIAIITVNGDDAAVKKVKFSDKTMSLIPLNPAYDTLTYTKTEIEQLPVSIIGKVIEIRRSL
jgi:repressor LexA